MSQPRSDTRERLRSVALELFAEQGYEKTSLREIAERLGVTKAALYYHFKTKESIVVSLFDDFRDGVAEIIDWAEAQPATDTIGKQIIDRYCLILHDGGRQMLRFMQENQPAFRELKSGIDMHETFLRLADLMTGPDRSAIAVMHARLALLAVGSSEVMMSDLKLDDDERRSVAVGIAYDLLDRKS